MFGRLKVPCCALRFLEARYRSESVKLHPRSVALAGTLLRPMASKTGYATTAGRLVAAAREDVDQTRGIAESLKVQHRLLWLTFLKLFVAWLVPSHDGRLESARVYKLVRKTA